MILMQYLRYGTTPSLDKDGIIDRMSQNRESSDRTKALLVLIATAGTVVFNGLAAAGYVNGVTPGIISAKYPTVVSPADYAFTIWTLICAGLIAFGVYQFLPSKGERFRGVRSIY